MVEHPNQSQPNPGARPPCTLVEFGTITSGRWPNSLLPFFLPQVSRVAIRSAVCDLGADVALLPGAVLPLGLALPPAAARHPPPEGHVQAEGQGQGTPFSAVVRFE